MSDANKIFDLSGKTAIVTGGTRGIGEMIATGFLKRGVKVYITSRKEEAVTAMVEKLSEYGDCVGTPSDLSTNKGVAAFGDWFAAREDTLDILVNNAGAAWGEPLEEFSESGWDRVMDLNVKSLFFILEQTTRNLWERCYFYRSNAGKPRSC